MVLSGKEPNLPTSFNAHVANLWHSAATNSQTQESFAIKKITNVFSKKILAKRALREIKLLQHFRGHRNVYIGMLPGGQKTDAGRLLACTIWISLDPITSTRPISMRVDIVASSSCE